MAYKRVLTMVPECSIGETQYCVKDCSICELAKIDKVVEILVPDDTPIPIQASINEEKIFAYDQATVTITYDRPISQDLLSVKVSGGLKVVSTNIINGNTVEAIISGDDSGIIGLRRISVQYANITRILSLTVLESFPIIKDFYASNTKLKLGDTIRLDINLNRALKFNEPLPKVDYDTNAFELIQDLTVSKTVPTNLYMLLQAKVGRSKTTISTGFEPIHEHKILISITDDEMVFATKEDIDYLFPELND